MTDKTASAVKLSNPRFFSQIVDLLQSARNNVVRTVNQTMVLTYLEIGKRLVEGEQGGKKRADYGKQVVKELSKVLTKEFGKGFSVDNIENMRRFYFFMENPKHCLGFLRKQFPKHHLRNFN